MWERLGYYGMRALLVLFMVDASATGGLGLSVENAAAIYGLYTAAVYLAALPGGWLADQLLGTRRAVWIGGLVIAAGYCTLAVPNKQLFFPGLGLVVLGSGLLKPNITAMVGGLYAGASAKRDAGFTIFYMGVNLGAALGPLICSAVAKAFGWRIGFGVAGLGMVMGLCQFAVAQRALGDVGRSSSGADGARRRSWMLVALAGAVVSLGVVLVLAGGITIKPVTMARSAATVLLAIAVVYFACAFFAFGLDHSERRCLGVILVLFLASAVFWAGFEQAGSSFNLFARDHTQRVVEWPASGGVLPGTFEVPAGWFQSLGAIFVILFAPVVAAIWVALERRKINLSPLAKFGLGLLLLAAGFLVMAVASRFAVQGRLVAPWWLVATYLLHSLGELCLSPVGLSSVTRLAPKRLVGQMVGVWFLATSLGNLLAGLIAGQLKEDTADRMPVGYLAMGAVAVCAGTIMLLVGRKSSRSGDTSSVQAGG